MSFIDAIRYRLRSLLDRRAHTEDVQEEFRFHLDLEQMHQSHAGIVPEVARLAARRRFGRASQYREEVRRLTGIEVLDGVSRNFRQAGRSLLRAPGFSAVAVVTLGLGIGGVAAIGAVAYGILIRPLPYPESSQLVAIDHSARGLGVPRVGLSDGLYLHYGTRSRMFEAIGLFAENDGVALTDRDQPARIRVALVTPNVFSILRVRPALGRLFTAEEGLGSAPRLVTISHALWVGRYGADSTIIGRMIELNRRKIEVVGVMPKDFEFPRPGTAVWYNLGIDPAVATVFSFYNKGIGRLRAGTTGPEAEADLRRALESVAGTLSDATASQLRNAALRPMVIPLQEVTVAEIRQPLLIMLGTALFALLIALANGANLVLIRAERQHREIAVEQALGASRGDVIRRVLSETLVVSAAAGLLALVLAAAGVEGLLHFLAAQAPQVHPTENAVVVFGLVTLLSGLSSGLLGAVALARIGRSNLATALQGKPGRTTGSRQWVRTQRVLVGGQVALAVALLIGATVMFRSLWRLQHVDLGFDPHHRITLALDLPAEPYSTYRAGAQFYQRVLEGIRAIPGVTMAEAATEPPLTPALNVAYRIEVEGAPIIDVANAPRAAINMATAGYFAAMAIPLVRGRTFEPSDVASDVPGVVVSAELARTAFPGTDPVGRRLRFPTDSAGPWFPIVGVVGSVPGSSIAGGPVSAIYFPVVDPVSDNPKAGSRAALYPGYMTVVVRTDLTGSALAENLRRAVRDVDPKVPLGQVGSMDQVVSDSTARLRLVMLLLTIAAGVALLLGTIGVFGVISYAVSQRRREFGIRLALGAGPGELERMLIRQGAAVAALGVPVGAAIALALVRFLGGLLFGVSPTDPTTFGAVGLVVFGVAIMASYLPARRTRGIDPVQTLRAE
ncbi:MAG: ADOP family duplicated permease [Gemmatimonadales bacterium]